MARWIEGRLRVFHRAAAGQGRRPPRRGLFLKNAGRLVRWRTVRSARSRPGIRLVRPSSGSKASAAISPPAFFEQNFHFALGLLEIFLAVARKLHAFFQTASWPRRADRFALSSFPTISSRGASEYSKSGFFADFGLFCRSGIHGCHGLHSLTMSAKVSRSTALLDPPNLQIRSACKAALRSHTREAASPGR